MGHTVYYQLVRDRLLDPDERRWLAEHVTACALSRSSEPYGFWVAEVGNTRGQIAFGATKLGRATKDLDRIAHALTQVRHQFRDAAVGVADDLQIIEWDRVIDTYVIENVNVAQDDVHWPFDLDSAAWTRLISIPIAPAATRRKPRPARVAGVKIGAAAQDVIARVMTGGDALPLHPTEVRSLLQAMEKLPPETPEAAALRSALARLSAETLVLTSLECGGWRGPRVLELTVAAAAAVTDGERVLGAVARAWHGDRAVEPIVAALCANTRLALAERAELRAHCT
ncbi:MAG: hypothetical protein HOV81_09280 [Kofleriaceae bacterium]|nr:hypothetical protein [Kofleriaceae bacterium]